MESLAIGLSLAVFATPAAPAHTMQHGAYHAGAMPAEAGQGAFAAIQDIVSTLEADPRIDWSKVDPGALRTHLVNMDALIISADVHEWEIFGGLEITLDGAGRAGEAPRRMVPAHSRELANVQGWNAAAGLLPGGDVNLTVAAPDKTQATHNRGLDFFGLIASGRHHQPHHLAIARGEMAH